MVWIPEVEITAILLQKTMQQRIGSMSNTYCVGGERGENDVTYYFQDLKPCQPYQIEVFWMHSCGTSASYSLILNNPGESTAIKAGVRRSSWYTLGDHWKRLCYSAPNQSFDCLITKKTSDIPPRFRLCSTRYQRYLVKSDFRLHILKLGTLRLRPCKTFRTIGNSNVVWRILFNRAYFMWNSLLCAAGHVRSKWRIRRTTIELKRM